MARLTFVFIFLSLTLLWSCDNGNGGGGGTDGDTISSDSTSDTTANQHMHRRDFSDLVAEFEDPQRREWQQPALVIQKLGGLRGKTVADIGAGTGYFSFRMAETAERVIAVDIENRFLEYIRAKLDTISNKDDLNIETRLAKADDPGLAPGEVDMVLLVNTYHHIEDRVEYFKKVKAGINENGVLAIVDFKKTELPVGPPPELKVTPEEVRAELEDAGFRVFEIDSESLQYQFLIFCR